MHPKKKGIITEQKIISKLLELGFEVSKPIGDNCRYDIILDHNNKLYRGQCKTGRKRKGTILFNTSSSRLNSRKTYQKNYIGAADYFIVYCWENQNYYFFPIGNTTPSRQVGLREDKLKNNQIKNIIFAKDFLLENMSAYLERDTVESLKFGESFQLPTPSQAEKSEGVETRRGIPKLKRAR